MQLGSRRRWVMMAAPAIAGVLGLASTAAPIHTAGAADADKTAVAERCAMRLSVSLLGKTPTDTTLKDANPQSEVDTMLQSPDFIERFSRFVNSQYNKEPGTTPLDDATYYMSKYVLQNNKPWSDMFMGQYKLGTDANGNVTVADDPNGLGYFRNNQWLVRYAGNEPAGIKLVTANRIMWNIIGLTLVASTNAPGADVSATGRQAQPCAGCHYDPWFALDKVASILTVRQADAKGNVTFAPQTSASVQILGGQTIHDDKELVTALVSSENYPFNVCRTAFKFLYGRAENKCDAPLFDRCVDTFKAQKTIQSAIGVVAKDPGFCQ